MSKVACLFKIAGMTEILEVASMVKLAKNVEMS